MDGTRHLSRRVTVLCAASMAVLIGLDLWRTWREVERSRERQSRFDTAQAEAAASRHRIEVALAALLERP